MGEKAQKKAKKKNGRPLKELDAEVFEGLCRIQCTLVEIAAVLKCSEDTVERWCKRHYGESFADALKRFGAGGRSSLRRLQWAAAESGNITMQIWLGKQWLNQKDRQDFTTGDEQINRVTVTIVGGSAGDQSPSNAGI